MKSAEETANEVRSGAVSPVELVEQALTEIDRLNPAINAFVSLRADEALDEARAMADAIAGGADPGPLAGLPLGVKDLQDVTGMVTTYGSKIHLEDPPATSDDGEVARLRAAGAIVVGKTNTPEFAWSGFTNPPAFGPTRNPWNLDLTPGGSSGGSAAALASQMVPVATASDGGGSIRIPANFSGLFGLKPNMGRIGHTKAPGWPFLSVSGPLTLTVSDAALLLDVTAGPTAGDPFALPSPVDSYRDGLRPWGGGRVHVSINLGWGPVDPDVQAVVGAAIDRLDEIGAATDEVESVFSEDPGRTWITLAAADGAFDQSHNLSEKTDLYDPLLLMQLQLGTTVTREAYQEALAKRYSFTRELDELLGEDGLLVAAVTVVPPYAAEGPHPNEVAGQPIPPTGFIRTFPFNLTGHPAASVPCGLTSEGLPVGLQVVGPRFREDLVLAFALSCEQAWPWSMPDISAI